MIFYLDPPGIQPMDFMADHGEYIGALGNKNAENKVTADKIAKELILEKEKEDKFLAVVIFNKTWQICILFNTEDGGKEILSKYVACPMYWFWISKNDVKKCMTHSMYKKFCVLYPQK